MMTHPDRVNSPGDLNVVALPGVVPSKGGLPTIVEGKMIGAIGISGVLSSQDGVIAKAGRDALARWSSAAMMTQAL